MAAPLKDEEKRVLIARRAARELKDGDYVNLGVGVPTLVPSHLPRGVRLVLHTENGMLGYGPYPYEGEEDPDLINAGKETISELPGCCYFGSHESFAMVRGGHLDATILGGMEVSEAGDLANWMVPGKKARGMGGAMDMVAGAKKVIVAMEHATKDGRPKIVKRCSLPLTGKGVVHVIVTERATFDVGPAGLVLREKSPGVTLEELRRATEPEFRVAPGVQ